MSSEGTFTVPKDRLAVRVHLDGKTEAGGTIFLEYTPGDSTTHQRVIAFLENPDGFFPLAMTQGAAPEFICKQNVKMIEVEYPIADDISFSLMRILNVTAHFTDDTSMSGELMIDAPREKSRLSDCLNTTHRFLSLRIEGRIFYLNKDALRKVVHAE